MNTSRVSLDSPGSLRGVEEIRIKKIKRINGKIVSIIMSA
jgi:hypothetical protein